MSQPPRIPKSDISIFFEKLSSLLAKITKKNKKHIVLCGDWNIDVLKDNSQTKELRSILLNHNMYLYINKPTRKISSIDQIASNLGNFKVNADIHHLALSDHETGQTLSFSVPKRLNIRQKCKKQWFERRRDLCDDNVRKFIKCISSLSFSEVYEETDCNKSFEVFHDIFKLFYDLCFPIIRVRVGIRTATNKWVTHLFIKA